MCVYINKSVCVYIYKNKEIDGFFQEYILTQFLVCLFLASVVTTAPSIQKLFFPDKKKIKVQRNLFIKLWLFRLKIKTLQEDGRCSAKEMCLRGRPLNGLLDRMR